MTLNLFYWKLNFLLYQCILFLTWSNSFSVNMNFKLQRRAIIETTKNGNANAAGLSFTPHKRPRPENWIIVNKCIFHVFTYNQKGYNKNRSYVILMKSKLLCNTFITILATLLTLRAYPTLGWCFTGTSNKNNRSNICIPPIPDAPMYRNTPYNTANGTKLKTGASTTETPSNKDINRNDTRWSEIRFIYYVWISSLET